MRGFYSFQPRVWRGKRLRRESDHRQPDPYAPSSPGYQERAKETVRALGPGMTLVNLGHPIGEPTHSHAKAPDFTPEPNPAPVVDPAGLSAPAVTLHEFKPGLGRG